MGYKLKTAPTVEPISLTEAKLHLKVDTDDTSDDTLITALIVAARQAAENYTGRAFIEQSWELKFEEFEEDEIDIPVPPLASVTSITYTDINNTTQTLSTDVYDVDLHSEPGRIFLKYSKLWPSTLDVENAITVTFKAGYGTTSASVPGPIKAAILLILAHLYENREDVVIGRQVNDLPKGSMFLLDPYRISQF